MSEKPEILIVGAGPTGLTLAIFLANAGVPFRIVDPKPGPTEETRAVGVQARTLEQFRLVGMTDRMLANGRISEAVTLWSRGKIAARAPLGEMGKGLSPHPYLFLLGQDQTENLLVERLGELGAKVEWGVAFESLIQGESEVEVKLQNSQGGVESASFRFVCGCDGARSPVRNAIGLEFPGGTYLHTFFVADVRAEGNVVRGQLNVALFENRFLALFPLKADDRYRLIGTLPKKVDPKNATIELVAPEVERLLNGTITDTRWFSVYRLHHRVAERFQSGRVFLLGDAGHVHSPVGGQGMNTGIGDAINLSWKLAEVVHGASEDLLKSYEAERIPFARVLVMSTDRAFDLILSGSRFAQLVRLRLGPLIIGFLLRLRPMRRRFFELISQIRIKYVGSPVSRGRLGRIRAGTRMPWVPGLFERQESNRWCLFVFGSQTLDLWGRLDQYGLDFAQVPLTPELGRAGYCEGFCLVRPDGYVGLAGKGVNEAQLDRYFRVIIGRR